MSIQNQHLVKTVAAKLRHHATTGHYYGFGVCSLVEDVVRDGQRGACFTLDGQITDVYEQLKPIFQALGFDKDQPVPYSREYRHDTEGTMFANPVRQDLALQVARYIEVNDTFLNHIKVHP